MNFIVARVEIKADYNFTEPRDFETAFKEYTGCRSESLFKLSDNKLTLFYRAVKRFDFDNLADMVANLERKIEAELKYDIKFLDNWSVSWKLSLVEGHNDEYAI